MKEIPHREASELEWLLFEQDGVISRRQLTAVMPMARLRQLIRSGRWTRPHLGIYLAHNGAVTPEQRIWIGVLSAGSGRRAVLAGTSALGAYGIRGVGDAAVHVYIPASTKDTNPPPFVVVHRITALPKLDYHRALPPRTSPGRSVVDAARWARTDDQARRIIASAFQQRLVDRTAIESALTRMKRVKRRQLIVATAVDADGGSESVPELDFLQLCRKGKLPTPTRQSVVTDASGRRRYRDAYFEEWGVHVEIDGAQHMHVAAWWADMQRQNLMWVKGDRVLRFPSWAIRNRPDEVIIQIRAALVAAGWPDR